MPKLACYDCEIFKATGKNIQCFDGCRALQKSLNEVEASPYPPTTGNHMDPVNNTPRGYGRNIGDIVSTHPGGNGFFG